MQLHRYIPESKSPRIASIPRKSFGILSAKKSSGTRTEIRAAISSPIISQLEISCRKSINEYLNISFTLGKNPFGSLLIITIIFLGIASSFSGSIFFVTSTSEKSCYKSNNRSYNCKRKTKH